MYPLRVVLGGTFDPLHNGHVRYALAAARALQAPVYLMPAADPVHRAPPGAAAGHRWAMVAAVAAEHDVLHAERLEIDLGPPTFTARTLRALRKRDANCAPLLLLGSDAFCDLPKWREYPDVLDMAHFAYVQRPDQTRTLIGEVADQWRRRRVADIGAVHQRRGGSMLQLDLDLVAMSATRIRAAIAAGDPWRERVPASVAARIEENDLYRAPGGDNGLQ